jgi:lipoyl(octanoyl) transferase
MIPWEDALALQQRLVFDMGEYPRRRGSLILCEHPPIVTVGRRGSRQHLRMDETRLEKGVTPVRWTNRGGGAWHQHPGQLAAYPILPIRAESGALDTYRQLLCRTLSSLLAEYELTGKYDARLGGITVNGRQIAAIGIAVKDWVSYHGIVLNVSGLGDEPLADSSGGLGIESTCMFRELRTPVRTVAVRESFLRHFSQMLGVREYYLSSISKGLFNPKRAEHARVTCH